jgi:putative peptidoglycan lipid II flippase
MKKGLKKFSLFRSTFIVASLTALSRIAGLIRDVLISNVLGVSFVADAFIVALRLPNIFRRITAEGAFSAAFVPIFSKKLLEGKASSINFSQDILYVLTISIIIITSLLQLLMPWVMYLMAYGFSSDIAKFELAIIYSRITVPYILFISLSSLGVGILNSIGKYSVASLSPVILNILLIIALALPSDDILLTGYFLSFAVMLSGFLQFILIFLTLRKNRYSLKLRRPKNYDQINKFMKLANPQIITGLILQANILLSGAIASFAQGGISTLYFAERLYQLPLALFGISIGTVLLPTLSSLHIKNDIAEINLVVRRSVKFALIMSIPAATGLMIISVPIITLIYQHGLFNELNTILVSKTLIAFSIGLPAFILIKIYLPIFYSMGDTKNPLRYSLISTAINIFMALFLFSKYGIIGIALSTSFSSWVNFLLLSNKSKSFMISVFSARLYFDLVKVILSSAAMAYVIFFLLNILTDFSIASQILIITPTGMLIYFLILSLLGVLNKNDISSIISR